MDKHRWYETSISVFKIPEGFIGVQSITDTFSEQSEISDMFHHLRFLEMKEVTKITYERV